MSDLQPSAIGGGDLGPPKADVLIHLDNTKAGMSKVDKAHVEQVINEMSAGSPFYLNEQRKSDARKKRIAEIAKRSSHFDKCSVTLPPPEWKAGIEKQVAVMEKRIEAARRFNQWFIHVDMDMFFAAVEEKLNPSLKTVPMAVGGMGMLATSNYIAREYGVRAGMPGFIAKRLCPELVLVRGSYDAYRAESEVVRGIAAEFDEHFHTGGLDELTLSVGHLIGTSGGDVDSTSAAQGKRFSSAAEVATEIRRRIFAATGLTASTGVAPTAALAKIVGNFNKPNGQYVLDVKSRAEVMEFMATLQIRKVPGIGKAMEEILASLGIVTCDQLYDQRHRLFYCIGGKTFEFLLEVGLGAMGTFGDSGNFEAGGSGRQSIGHERTFGTLPSQDAMEELVEKCLQAAHETLLEETLLCEQVVLKLKDKSFAVHQYSKKLKVPTDRLEDLERAVGEIVRPHLPSFASFRLLGVRLTDLTAPPPSSSDAAADGDDAVTSISPQKQATLSQLFARHEAVKSTSNHQDDIFDVDGSSSADTLSALDKDVIVVEEEGSLRGRKRARPTSCPRKVDVVVVGSDSD